MNIDKFIDGIKDYLHNIYKAKEATLAYYDNFKEFILPLEKNISSKQFEDLLQKKIQFKSPSFNEKQFIQAACETTVNSYFAKHFTNSFAYEKKVNPSSKKNIECQFQIGSFTYNIEVKCSDFELKEKIDNQDAFKFGTYGRIDEYKDTMKEIGNLMVEGQKIKKENPKPLIELRKMDNNLKDFLISANQKFNPTPNENEVNILVVCCGDANDMQNWHNYMFAQRGLFTKNSFCHQNKYLLVDLVVLSNIYHRHKFFDKVDLSDNWNLASAFNLVFSNRYRKLNKEKSIKFFLNIFPHYTDELEKYEIPEDNGSEFMRQVLKSIVGIPAFVKHNFTDKGKMIF